MNDTQAKYAHFDSPALYRICVAGELGAAWSDRLGGMEISVTVHETSPPVTTLEGVLKDQAALTGVLNSLYELHMPVLSVERLET
jgi:hypothetical protein